MQKAYFPEGAPSTTARGIPAQFADNARSAMRLVGQRESRDIDDALLQLYSLDQLMELAGLSVALVVAKTTLPSASVLVLVGPGNNGGDALVAARHLALWGRAVALWAPRVPARLSHVLHQAAACGCAQLAVLPEPDAFAVTLDGVFGFGFAGDPRAPYDAAIRFMAGKQSTTLISIDVPSGWPVDDTEGDFLVRPDAIVSLTAPKTCLARIASMRGYRPRHFLGGRFVPPSLQTRFGLDPFPIGSDLIVEVEL
jgi:NAD(P)H-hydrate epimerase